MALDLSRYQGRQLSRSDVFEIMKFMYTGIDANELIEQLLAPQDPLFISSCLEEIVQKGDPYEKCDTVYMMARLGLPAAIRCIDILLSDQDVDVRCAGCRILPVIDGENSCARLLRCLQTDPSELVRYIAVDGIGIVGDASAIPILQHVAETDKGCDYEGRPIREKALKVIAYFQDRDGLNVCEGGSVG